MLTLHEWMSRNVPSYSQDKTHPVVIELNGQAVPPAEWPLCLLRPDSDVRIYPIPYGTGLEIAAWVSVAVSIASTAYALFFAPKPELGGFSSSNASSLDLNRGQTPQNSVIPLGRRLGETGFTRITWCSR
ncbi:kinase [Klebsiella pneumoniae]|uniref:Kinase n=1 Tax=Klebsiella pneumoniae TaxID=573 RepID=A0A377TG82_KLEPN|nr:kinase [Klebsiella pneumoniae]